MAFKDNYIDEIATRRYQIIDNKTGAIINPDVALKRVDTPSQAGDRFLSKDLNALCKRLNELESAVVTKEDVTLVGKALKFSSGLMLSNGANEVLYQFVKGIGHTNVHTGNIGECTAGDSIRVGNARVFAYTTVANPAGNNYVTLPLPQGYEGRLIYLSVANTNIYASRVSVIGAMIEGNGITVVFNTVFSGNVQLSVLALSD